MASEIHPSAVIDKTARLGDSIKIGPNCVIDKNVEIGEGCCIDANAVIGDNVKLGKNNRVYANAVIGRPPQLLGFDPEKETGGLRIGDDNVIREQVTIHPGMNPGQDTVIGSRNLLMIGVHLGHDCVLEDDIVISNYSQISGHGKIEQGVWISGLVAVHQFVTFGKWCYAAGFAGVNHDVPPFVIVAGHYPPEVRTVNTRGLARAGFSEEQKQNIQEAFRKIFKKSEGSSMLERVESLAENDGLDPNVRHMVDSIIKSSKHRFGRHLELYRENH